MERRAKTKEGGAEEIKTPDSDSGTSNDISPLNQQCWFNNALFARAVNEERGVTTKAGGTENWYLLGFCSKIVAYLPASLFLDNL